MIIEITDQAGAWYQQAERKAAEYFESLYKQVMDQSYVTNLTQDFAQWSKQHVRNQTWISLYSRVNKKPSSKHYHLYLRWLERRGELDDYLDRSVSYMYMRDLGKTLDSSDTAVRIQRLVGFIKKHMIESSGPGEGELPAFLSLAGVYRWAKKEGVEEAAIWVIHKLKTVGSHIPDGMSADHGIRKLIKIIIGVVLHVIEDMDDDVPQEERSRRLDAAIRLGYSYGLTYPFIDDLLDSGVLNPEEKIMYSQMIRTTLLQGSVPAFHRQSWSEANADLIGFVHSELGEAFDYMKRHQSAETRQTFFEQSYVFFESQDVDRVKQLSNASYRNEELFLPIIIKSASSRLIVRSVIGAAVDEGFDHRTFYYGIYNQLADDFADMHDDLRDGAVTPYTYYWTYQGTREDLINPFELYWTVISHLIHDVYHSDAKARDVILNRAINGLKRSQERLGKDKYAEMMAVFAPRDSDFHQLLEQMASKADRVEFFDKLLRDQMIHMLRNDRTEKAQFKETVRAVRNQLKGLMPIPVPGEELPVRESLIEAANYSLEGSGKRLRPIMAWVMGVSEYGLPESSIAPLVRSLEYMHTASLIFDDLPSQDNAASRRGRPTLHEIHDSATAELTGLFMIQKAMEEQSSLTSFDPKAVLSLIHYSSRRAADMCRGQAMDLGSRGKTLTLEQLNTICFYKTGIAFEASLVMPAILAQAPEAEIELLKSYAYHAGIAFQIKDDLLDLEGSLQLLGKPAGKDAENNNSTFVTLLGREGASKAMWEHYCLASEVLHKMPRRSAFLHHLLDYLINRDY
ncbi:polyprenyl synthetase family protein [Paenibacillus soyae]|uniref:Polyprenyl synthetase family protein n=1 Tax=Paenibacillus soyae TaxID=2969249 RepID=A0A9X2ML91_9BACL|nr:polyprenyl synthetase family protein [Paenibacillus soyae]MCR2802721.1 polyprenyl synthetase family protein [Paenibacillus soyae]